MSFETTKAMKRRFAEHDAGGFHWRDVFRGQMLDVGCGPDKLKFDTCIGFDEENGDANHLSDYFPANSLHVLHGSHVLEHMADPRAALRDWLTLVKPGGYVVQTVPDIGAYERFEYPSKYNPDHRSSWSMIYLGSCFPIHCHIPTFLADFSSVAEVLLARYVEVGYDWKLGRHIDQTMPVEAGVEIWNEFVLRKNVELPIYPMPAYI